MKTLYLDCGMGAAGDMLTAALLELLPDQDTFIEEMNRLGIPGVHVKKSVVSKCGINGTHISVTVDGAEEESPDTHVHTHGHETHSHEDHAHDGHDHEHSHECGHEHTHDHEHSHDHELSHDHEHSHEHAHSHHHSSMADIESIIHSLALPAAVQKDVLAVYSLIAEAESHAHGVPVTDIHFHEVGTMDAIADITAVCLLMHKIAPSKVVVSPIHVGSGHVRCQHGILPVPAPATAYILRDVPIYGGGVKGELCTPTGAALLKHFADSFGEMPVMKTRAIGYGMGRKDFPAANCVRALLGETDDAGELVTELRCNLDDMTPEEVGFAMERLLETGALDVYTVPIGMKKSRPGVLLCALCKEDKKEALIHCIFKYTTTLGIREDINRRYTLSRTITERNTPLGTVRKKTSEGYGVKRFKYEYEDLARIAKEKGLNLDEIQRFLEEN